MSAQLPGRALAALLWGDAAVALALAAPCQDITLPFLARVSAVLQHGSPGYLRSWALAQTWPDYVRLIHVITGAYVRSIATNPPTC
jgi:hypothetical protein